MAASSSLQSILASSLTCRPSMKKTRKPYYPLQRFSSMKVRCMAEDNQKGQATNSVSSSSPPPQPQPISSSPPPPPPPSPSPTKPKVSTKFSEVLAFSGPAPERINGRLAMIGFVAALAVQLWNGQNVFDQISNGGIPWFIGTSVVLSLPSLIPLFKGVNVESKSEWLMTSDAEHWNGRFAMLGLIALAFTEYVKDGTLV